MTWGLRCHDVVVGASTEIFWWLSSCDVVIGDVHNFRPYALLLFRLIPEFQIEYTGWNN